MKITTLAITVLAAAGANCLADELIVTGLSDIVQTINLDTGDVDHRGVCTGAVQSMAVADGTLYLGGFFGDIYLFDMDANQVVGDFQIPGQAHAMAWDGTNLLIVNGPSTIVSVDPADGSVVHTRSVPTSDISAIGIDAGGLFVGGQSTIALRSHIGASHFDFFAACGSMINSMAFGPQHMYLAGTTLFGGQSGTVYKFDKFVGGVNYSDTFSMPNDATALLSYRGLLYVGGSDGMVHEVDPESGQILRSFDMSTEVRGIAPTQGLISCPADYDISGDLNFFDIAQFLDLFAAGLPAADANGDGVHDFFDVQTFLGMYNAGCP